MSTDEAQRRGRGRPTSFTEETAEMVLDLIASGRGWPDVVNAVGVSVRSIMRWASERPAFKIALDEAKVAAAELLASQNPLEIEADAQRARVLAERNRWLAARWAPSTYGDRLAVDLRHEIDIRAALDAAQGRVVAGVAVETGGAPRTARLGTSSVSRSWPELVEQPEPKPALPDFMT